ncbi:unnamed protein product [Mesocestoides corti]|uniref:SCP domain-containing protein n=1 Tax=Mesocestoides corti TaxID=53468 RepID=A0A0R3U7T8_MESCO|nr:unnamed protein product [Mesocestoides corti]
MMRAAYLLALTSVIFAEVPTEEERQRIVELHAQIRESVEPPARFMMMIMVWAPATAFGCAQKQCSNEADSSKHMYLTACLYSPA